MISVPGSSATACNTPAACVSACGQNATSEPWKSCKVAERPTPLVPAVPNEESPFDQASLFYDDRDLMRTRIERLEHPRIHVQTPPSRTVHLVGNAVIEAADEAKRECVVGSTVIMVEYRDEQQRIFAGRQHHRLRREGDALHIVQKRVDLINCDSAFEAMAIPV